MKGPFEFRWSPKGWDYYHGKVKTANAAPKGWDAWVLNQEERENIAIEWRVNERTAARASTKDVEDFSVSFGTTSIACDQVHWAIMARDSQITQGKFAGEKGE